MRRALFIVLLLILVGAGAWTAWWYTHREKPATELVLHGNVDLRQVLLAFNNNERIKKVWVEEGARVQEGELVAELETSRLEPQVEQARAQAAAQQQVYDRLYNGSRPEEIAQADANVKSAEADRAKAQQDYDRDLRLKSVRVLDQLHVKAVSEEQIESDRAALKVADARLIVNQKALELAKLGPRKEEVHEALARLHGNSSQLAFLEQQLKDTKLYAPAQAIVRSRLLEPGEMVTPQRPVLSLALINPKWVRAYVSEVDLGKVRMNMKATIAVDSFPNRRFDGWVGFISPVAEFTPKPVQTEELRTSLVYEVRVYFHDPNNELCLGMPATVFVPLAKEK